MKKLIFLFLIGLLFGCQEKPRKPNPIFTNEDNIQVIKMVKDKYSNSVTSCNCKAWWNGNDTLSTIECGVDIKQKKFRYGDKVRRSVKSDFYPDFVYTVVNKAFTNRREICGTYNGMDVYATISYDTYFIVGGEIREITSEECISSELVREK